MLTALLLFNMLPAGCLMWLLFAVMPDLKLLSCFFSARSRLMFGLRRPGRRSSQRFKEGWELMWVHTMLMGGCRRAARPSYRNNKDSWKGFGASVEKHTQEKHRTLIRSSNSRDAASPAFSLSLCHCHCHCQLLSSSPFTRAHELGSPEKRLII